MSSIAISPTPVRSHLRITRRGRIVLGAVAALPAIVLATASLLGAESATATSESVQLEVVTVEAGETLWQLAESVAPAADPRDVVHDVLSLNGITSADIEAGVELEIPAKYSR
jgi:hypothetical protein